MAQGYLIALEGTDGSGKTEQTKLLVQRLKDRGFNVAPFDFPRYHEPSAYFVEEYLNGRYGGADDVDPKAASLFYALDRFAAAPQIRDALADSIVVINRYVASNMAHQGAKLSGEERTKFFKWIAALEYKTLGIPRPNLNIILHVPAATAQQLVDRKAERTYLKNGKRDVHEDDIKHLENAERSYQELAELFPTAFKLIECTKNDAIMSRQQIADLVWAEVSTTLQISL